MKHVQLVVFKSGNEPSPGVFSCQVLANCSRWRASDPQIANPDGIHHVSSRHFSGEITVFAFYRYLPFFGIWGLAAMLANHLADMIERRSAGLFTLKAPVVQLDEH